MPRAHTSPLAMLSGSLVGQCLPRGLARVLKVGQSCFIASLHAYATSLISGFLPGGGGAPPGLPNVHSFGYPMPGYISVTVQPLVCGTAGGGCGHPHSPAFWARLAEGTPVSARALSSLGAGGWPHPPSCRFVPIWAAPCACHHCVLSHVYILAPTLATWTTCGGAL